MCGIIGITRTGHDTKDFSVTDLLLNGLKRLEYRGYDSAGLALMTPDGLDRRRAAGKLASLKSLVNANPIDGDTGIAHTRWATHGPPNIKNAHPQMTEQVALVHNGIIENHGKLRDQLIADGMEFESDTDTETIVHLLDHAMREGATPIQAVRDTISKLMGAYSFVAIFKGHNDLMIGARMGTPLIAGVGDQANYFASDVFALAGLTDRVIYLADGDIARITPHGISIENDGQSVTRDTHNIAISSEMMGKNGYAHFMQKEIFEQPAVVADTLDHIMDDGLGDLPIPADRIDRLTISACGTAYLAGRMAKYWIEDLARMPVEMDVASEFRYRRPVLPENGLALFISQSGETLDTLEALRLCKGQRQKILSILNTPESTIGRESDMIIPTLAGPEIGVASTKAFTTQLVVLAILAMELADDDPRVNDMRDELSRLSGLMAQTLNLNDHIEQIGQDIAQHDHALFLGRGINYPMAMEGALKLKEISYIHAEGYAAGEMKHGPIALIDDDMPVIMIAPHDRWFDKSAANLAEARSRGAKICLITDQMGASALGDQVDWCITIPTIHPMLSPILTAIPVQLLAYHAAAARGTDIDQPRNLAKSVTVE
jgi:glucosamine--fructose-6-phosphate aminotransferase (isomerizing)